jgi:transglutaminase-like putative cysteine protease
MPVVSIRHATVYRYRTPVRFAEHRVMYRPLEAHDQRLLAAELTISPEPALFAHSHDISGATVGVAKFAGRSDRLTFESQMRVEHTPAPPFALEDTDASLVEPCYHADEAPELARNLARRHLEPEIAAWARRFGRPGAPLSAVLSEMTQAVQGDFAYRLRLDGGPRAPAETLALRSGSCRDFAVLMMEAARSLGVASRFVSGYVYSTGAGRTGGGHTHAWMQAYLPGCGWVDFDPTNGIVGNRDLIRVACAADPRLAIPLHGAFHGPRSSYLGMDVEVAVTVEGERTSQPKPAWRVARGT